MSEIHAVVARSQILNAIIEARARFTLDLAHWAEVQEQDIQKFMATKRVGFFWLFRPSRAKARECLLDGWWEAFRIQQRITGQQCRLNDIEEIVSAKNLMSITLPECDLELLKDFL